MDIKELQEQVNTRWELQLNNPCHKSADASHALVHLTKALGMVATEINDAEHEHREMIPNWIARYLADIVICAARIGKNVDLDLACDERLEEKFPFHTHHQAIKDSEDLWEECKPGG